MKKLGLNLMAAVAMIIGGGSTVSAENLYITGSACQWGWRINADGNAMVEDASTPGVYKGITYLAKNNSNFKFVCKPDWSGNHYTMKPYSEVKNGVFELVAAPGDDNTEWKLWLGDGMEEGNYEITVDLRNPEAMTATLKRAEYQDSPIWGKSIFMVGDVFPENSDVWNKGWPNYYPRTDLPISNTFETPYIYEAKNLNLNKLNEGAYKFVIADNCDWTPWAWLFQDNDNPALFKKGQDGDKTWNLPEAGNYDVLVNSKTREVKVSKTVSTAVEGIGREEAPVEYFTITGMKVNNPENGIFIRRQGNKVEKVALK